MSIDRQGLSRLACRCALLAAILAACGIGLPPIAVASDFVFSPTLELFLFKDGNPNVVGSDPVSQDVARAQLGLEFGTLTPRTKWELDYFLFHENYRDEQVLDNTGHRLYTTLRHDFSRRSDMTARLYGTRTQRQVIQRETIDVPDSLVPRTFINRAALDVNGRVDFGARNFMTWLAGGSLQHYEETPEVQYNDSDQFLVGAGWGREITRRSSVGLAYVYRQISYETTLGVDTHTLAITTDYDIGEKTTLRGALGVVQLQREDGESDSTVSFNFGVRQELDRYNDLRTGLRRVITPGFGIGGATLDEGGYVGWRFRRSRLWWVDINATYWHRELVGTEGTQGTEGFRTRSAVWWTPLNYLSFAVFHVYTNQNSLSSTGSSSDTDYNTGGFSVLWEILGNKYGGLRRGR